METFTVTFKETATISIESLYRCRTNVLFTSVILPMKTIAIVRFERRRSSYKNGYVLISVVIGAIPATQHGYVISESLESLSPRKSQM